jgi:AraC-like DNA-binding protein
MTVIQRVVYWILLPLPFVLLLAVYIYIQAFEIDIVNNNDFRKYGMDDRSDHKGNSVSTVQLQKGIICLSYNLGDVYQYAYAGLQIDKKDKSFYSLESLAFVLKIQAKENVRLSLIVNQFIDNYSDTSKPNTIPILMKSFEVKKGYNEIEIKASDINVIPDWWLALNPKKANNVEIKSLNKVQTIWLFSHNTNPHNKSIELKIEELKLKYDIVPFLNKFLIFALIYYILIVLFSWKVKKMYIKYIYMPIEMTKFKEKIPETQSKILEYIGANYQNPNLRLSDVATESGISEEMTSELLKQHSDLSFRQYLNQIRMEEAKRLLKVSSLQISEIAFKVGYNNVQHFNRVFKEYTDLQPKNFREHFSGK